MKNIILILVLIFSGPVYTKDFLSTKKIINIPDEFREYFYNSEILAQIYLNDASLFEAAISIKPNGKITLIRIVDSSNSQFDDKSRAEWEINLKKGIIIGDCSKDCPSDLVAAEYQLDKLELKLFSKQYETQKVVSKYLTLPNQTPNGLIVNNSLSGSFTSVSKAWNINSSLLSSINSWTQRMSLSSYGSDQKANMNTQLYEMYTQKEYPGNFLRIGIFSPNTDKGNVETNGISNGSIAGVMWGTSNALLFENESVSAVPIYVTGGPHSIAEVWQGDRMIYTQQLQVGMQALDSRRLPNGVYDVTIKIIDNSKVIETISSQVYKPLGWSNPNQRWRLNTWAGKIEDLSFNKNKENLVNSGLIAGMSADYLFSPRIILGSSSLLKNNEFQLSSRANISLDLNSSLYTQYTLKDNNQVKNKSLDLRYIRNLSQINSVSVFYSSVRNESIKISDLSKMEVVKNNNWGGSLFFHLPRSVLLALNGEHFNSNLQQGFSINSELTKNMVVANRDVSLRFNVFRRPDLIQHNMEQGVNLGLTFSLEPKARNSISVDMGVNNTTENYTSVSYQYKPKEIKYIDWVNIGSAYSKNNRSINLNTAFENHFINGDFYSQYNFNDANTALGLNLSQIVAIGDGKFSVANGGIGSGLQSAIIVDIDTDEPELNIVAVNNNSDIPLKRGRNIISTDIWHNDNIKFFASKQTNAKVFPDYQSLQMNRGSVKYLKLKAIKTTVLIGLLLDERGQRLMNRQVNSDITSGFVNAEGIVTLEMGVNNKTLTVSCDEYLAPLTCVIPEINFNDKDVQFHEVIQCRRTGTTK